MEKKKIWIFVGAMFFIVLAGLGIVFFASNKANAPVKTTDLSNGNVAGVSSNNKDQSWIEGLAKQLSEKGMVMYGAYWCSHCNNQKKEFGDAFKYVDYVECDAKGPNANPDECSAKGIEGYPTWIYQGQKYSGEQSLDKLAEIIGYSK